MSITAVAWALKQELPAIPKMILITLADHHNGETGQCNPSVRRICAMAGVNERTAERHIAQLFNLGFLTIRELRREDGSRTSNQYNLLMDGASESLGGDSAPPGGVPESPQEPGIESTEDSFTNVQESSTPQVKFKKEKKPRITFVDDAFREQMRQRFGNVFGDTIQERIDEALGHKAALRYHDMQAYARGWLRRDAEKLQGTKNGKSEGNTVEDWIRLKADIDERQATAAARRGADMPQV